MRYECDAGATLSCHSDLTGPLRLRQEPAKVSSEQCQTLATGSMDWNSGYSLLYDKNELSYLAKKDLATLENLVIS
jgi:hypothetical protein